MALNYVTVTGTFDDGSGSPLPATGGRAYCTFTPNQAVYASGVPLITPAQPIQASINNGSMSVQLLATDNAGLTFGGLTGFFYWTVTLVLNGQNQPSWSFFLPHTPSPVDLSALINTAASGGGATLPLTTLGDLLYENATPAAARLPGNTTEAKQFLTQTGTGTVSAAPAWAAIAAADVPGFDGVAVTGTPSSGQVPMATSGSAATWQPLPPVYQAWQFLPETYGAKGDGKIVSDGAMTSSSATLTCATSAPFTSGDVGKKITVEGAGTTLAGTSTASALSTTISAFISATQVTLTASAGTTVSGRTVCYGTDDTTAINDAITAATAYGTANHYYAEIIFAPHVYMIAGALVQGGATKTNSQIPLPVIPITGNPALTLAFIGTQNNAGPEMFAGSGDTPAVASNGTILASTLTGCIYSGTFGQPAVIGGPTVEQGYTGGFTNLWNNLVVVVDGLTILVPPIASLSGIDLTSCTQAEIKWLRALPAVPGNTLAGSGYNPVWGGGQSFPKGLTMPQGGNNAHCVIGSYCCYGFATGLEAYEHTTWTELITILCGTGVVANGSSAGHGVTGLKWSAEANNTHLASAGGPMSFSVLSMQSENNSQYAAGWHVADNAGGGVGNLFGRIGMNTSQGVANITVNGASNLEIILDFASGSPGQQQRGVVGPPSVPSSTVAFTNPYWRHAWVIVSGGTVSAIAVDGLATGLTSGAFRVPSGKTITLTYTVAPTWKWWID